MANETLAVLSQSGQSLSFFDLTTGKRVGVLEDLAPEPHELAYDDRSQLLYVTHAYRHGWYASHGAAGVEVSVIDCTQLMVVDTINLQPYSGPHGIQLDQKHDLLYVSIEYGFGDGGGMVGIDLKTRKIVKAIASGWKSHWFAMTPDGKKAYTCNKEADFISILDLEAGQMVGTIDAPAGTEQPGMSTDGRFVYFPTPTVPKGMWSKSGDFHMQVIDTSSDRVVRTVPLDFQPGAIHVDSKDRLLIGQFRFDLSSTTGQFPKLLPGRVTVLAPSSQEFRRIAEFEVGLAPLTIYTAPDASQAFAANIFAGTVTIIDLDRMKLVDTLDVDPARQKNGKGLHQGAHGMALVPPIGSESK